MTSEAPAPGEDRTTGFSLRLAAAALRDQGRLAEAETALRRAATIAADDPDVHAELGLTLSMMNKPRDAEPSYRRALELRPDDLDSLSNLAATLKLLERNVEAEAMLRRLLEISPDHVPALRNLGVLLKDSARYDEARTVARRAAQHGAGLETHLQGYLAVTPMVTSVADIDTQRQGYDEGLEALDRLPVELDREEGRANLPWYYLAYHGRDDRELLSRTADVLARRMPSLASSPTTSFEGAAGKRARIRVGFCSEFLRNHTIGRLYEGVIRQLDRSRFEPILIHASHSAPDPFRAALDASVDRAIQLPRDPQAQRPLIASMNLDVLFYPDIGMSAETYFLSHTRLAPVQATSWGHPNTTGVPAIDYFVSSDAIEPDGAEELYRERLVRLSRLPCVYPKPPSPPAIRREDLRLPARGTLYGCPQSLFKFHPDFDAVLAAIAEGDPDGHIVLIAPHIALWADVLRARWDASGLRLGERVSFLPRLSTVGFLAHLAQIDVLLDPLHFGSGNTLYEGLSLGVPIVTSPGRFMRGRIVAAAYKQMKIADAPIAPSAESYADVALALGRDPERRRRLSEELCAKGPGALFDDTTALHEFEAFLEAAVDAADRGERLPSGWRPNGRITPQ